MCKLGPLKDLCWDKQMVEQFLLVPFAQTQRQRGIPRFVSAGGREVIWFSPFVDSRLHPWFHLVWCLFTKANTRGGMSPS